MTKEYWIKYENKPLMKLEDFLKEMDKIELNGTMPFEGFVQEKIKKMF